MNASMVASGLIALSLGSLAGCNSPPTGTETVHGEIANGIATTSPADGSGEILTPGGYCTGVAIDNWWVLTANHCFDHNQDVWGQTWFSPPTGTGSWVVNFGNTGSAPTQSLPIATVYRYPGDEAGGAGVQRVDLALVRLASPFEMSGADDDWQIPLWPGNTSDLSGITANCYGWGGGSSELLEGQFTYSSFSDPFFCTCDDGCLTTECPSSFSYFRGDYTFFTPVSPYAHQGGDSGSGCFVDANGMTYLSSIYLASEFGVSTATDSYSASDTYGPELGAREWIDSTIFAGNFTVSSSGVASTAPAVSSQGKNQLDVFWQDSSNNLRQWRYNNGWYTSASSADNLGTSLGLSTLGPSSASWGSGRIDVFAIGSGPALVHKWYSGGAWQPWEVLSLFGAPTLSSSYRLAVSSWGTNRLDIFAVASSGAVYHVDYDSGWNSWENLGGIVSSAPASTSWSSGRIDLVAMGGGNAIYHKWYDSGTGWGPSQTSWENLGGDMTGDPAITSYRPGRLDIFATSAINGHLMHKWFEGGWSAEWIDMGFSAPPKLAAASWGPGRIDVFGKNSDGSLFQTWLPY